MAAKARTPRRATLALFGVAVMLCGLGCSTRSGSVGGRGTASQSASLSGPFTVTLSVPSPLAPLSPVLLGSNSVELGQGATVASGTVVGMGSGSFALEAESGALLNDAWSRGLAVIQDRVSVRGTLHASQRTLGSGVSLGGSDTNPPFDPPSSLTWNVVFPTGPANDVSVNPGQAITLTPGRYGNVEVHDPATLTLATGTYYLKGLTLHTQSTVNLNQGNGPVIVYVSDTIVLNGSYVSLGGAEPDLLIGYFGQNNVTVQSVFDGAIIAPSALLALQPVGLHKGFFAAQDVDLRPGGQVQYRFPAALVAASNPNGGQCQQLLADAGIPPQNISRYCTICSSPDDTDNDGVIDCLDECPYDHHKTKRGITGCNSPDIDSDGDGVPDPLDRCPLDPNNVTPGQCGCVGQPGLQPAGTLCTDTACPQSGATCNGAGVCGNRSVCSPCPGGLLIQRYGRSEWLCGIALPPETLADGGTNHITTGAAASWPVAMNACAAKGMQPIRINTPDDNQWTAQFLTAPIWLGANDLTTSGQWRWSTSGGNNGDLFWVGGPTGSRQNNLYANWGNGAPGAAQCAALRPGDGRWFDANCGESLGYVCEYNSPRPGLTTDTGEVAGGPRFPLHFPTASCVDPFDLDAGGLPDSLAELIKQVNSARDGSSFYGVAKNPPPDGSVCLADQDPNAALSQAIGVAPDSGAGCWFTNQQLVNFPSGGDDGGPYTGDCQSDDDCTKYVGPDYVCRQIKNDLSCSPADAGDAALTLDTAKHCLGRNSCVRLQCPQVTESCREIRLCSKTNTSFDSGLDPGSNLDAGAFNPASMFGGTLPDASPSATYDDPPMFDGGDHTWCHMVPQHPVAPANEPAQNTNGSSGQGSPISFSFDPNLVFKVNANPLALGENAMGLHAAASLAAKVQLNNFLGQHYTADIVDIAAGLQAQRCSANSLETKFIVLNLDVLSNFGLGIPVFDSTTKFPKETAACNNAVGQFTLWANRAKKAFRDAQQLLSAYKSITSDGGQLASTLCNDIMGAVNANDVTFFPGGLICPQNEPVEVTINRFVEYLQAPGLGQISRLRHAASNLVNQSALLLNNSIPNLNVQFLDIERDESQTILNVPFAIGPVPMVLQVDVFAQYGITGHFNVEIKIPLAQMAGLDDSNTSSPGVDTPIKIARAEVNVMPFAAAGLSAFVGAGVDLGAFSATLGIEGQVTLGKVSAPVYAGAGLDLLEQFDSRLLPPEIGTVSAAGNVLGTLFQFSKPKSFNFMVWFDYGAGIQLSDILRGAINAKLHVSFFFFSSTWRVEIVHFNGWSTFINLVQGSASASTSTTSDDKLADKRVGTKSLPPPAGSTTIVTTGPKGGPSMGLAEAQLPLTVLQPLVPPIPPIDDAGNVVDSAAPDVQSVPFNMSKVQSFFYDNQCCAHKTQGCDPNGTPHCCPDFDCVQQVPDASDSGICVSRCVPQGANCKANAEVGCCPGLSCDTISGTCQPPCPTNGQNCATQACCAGQGLQCCSGPLCTANTCCLGHSSPCMADSDCCTSTCVAGQCE